MKPKLCHMGSRKESWLIPVEVSTLNCSGFSRGVMYTCNKYMFTFVLILKYSFPLNIYLTGAGKNTVGFAKEREGFGTVYFLGSGAQYAF